MNDFTANVTLARKGDTAAFAKLYSMVYEDLYHVALYSLRNEQDACDAVSETVLDAFSSIGKLKNEEAFRAWIMKILFAKIKRRQKEYINRKTRELDETAEPSDGLVFENADLRDALSRLDETSRSILSLSVLGGYSSFEIGKIYGIRPASVRSKLSRIKQKLRLDLTV